VEKSKTLHFHVYHHHLSIKLSLKTLDIASDFIANITLQSQKLEILNTGDVSTIIY